MRRRAVWAAMPLFMMSVIAAGCGSSGNSAANYYSVHQVQAAFAAQGIELHKDAPQRLPAFVGLHSDQVLVMVRASKPSRASPSYDLGRGPDVETKHGNVLAVYKVEQGVPVTAALATLH